MRVGKLALIKAQRYAHAKQFKRHRKQVKFLAVRLGRIIRDIRRKIEGNEEREAAFTGELAMAVRLRLQKRRQEGPKLYSLHAPETECIGKGKAHKPYEFGCKVSITTTNAKVPGGMFVLHAKALHGNPYDGHTLRTVIEELTNWIGVEPERAYVDKGYVGHLKQEHRMDRNYLKAREGDRINAVLAAAGYNFRRIAQWLKVLLFKILYPLDGLKNLAPA